MQSKQNFRIRKDCDDYAELYTYVAEPGGYKGVHKVDCPRDSSANPKEYYSCICSFQCYNLSLYLSFSDKARSLSTLIELIVIKETEHRTKLVTYQSFLWVIECAQQLCMIKIKKNGPLLLTRQKPEQ